MNSFNLIFVMKIRFDLRSIRDHVSFSINATKTCRSDADCRGNVYCAATCGCWAPHLNKYVDLFIFRLYVHSIYFRHRKVIQRNLKFPISWSYVSSKHERWSVFSSIREIVKLSVYRISFHCQVAFLFNRSMSKPKCMFSLETAPNSMGYFFSM